MDLVGERREDRAVFQQTLTGANVGDLVIQGYRSSGSAYAGTFSADFETVITVDDQIQQVAVGNLSGTTFTVKLVPAGTI